MTDLQKDIIRIGKINYTNVWPMFYYFDQHSLSAQVELVSQVPTSLNRAMLAGTVDMGPISSFAYGASFDQYVLFPDMSVSAFGKVNSILLFMKKPLAEVINGTIALPTTSATSVNLLKIIVERFYGGKPTYFDAAPSLSDMLDKADAALLIGDDAIRASWSNEAYEVLDLGQLWREFTGCSMTFAVWAIRKETVALRSSQVTEIVEAFLESKRLSLQRLDALAETAFRQIGGTAAYWHNYFSQLIFDFGQSQWNGLQLYFQYAWELGLIDHKVPLQIWSGQTVVQVNE